MGWGGSGGLKAIGGIGSERMWGDENEGEKGDVLAGHTVSTEARIYTVLFDLTVRPGTCLAELLMRKHRRIGGYRSPLFEVAVSRDEVIICW